MYIYVIVFAFARGHQLSITTHGLHVDFFSSQATNTSALVACALFHRLLRCMLFFNSYIDA